VANGLTLTELNTRRATLKKKLADQKRVFASWICFGHPSIAEILSRSGVDFIGIDLEHTVISLEQARDIISACQATGTLCLPRISSHNASEIKRLLDAGADGIIAPTVETAEQAEELVSYCRYAPHGKRGFGISRGQGYGFDFDEYITNWKDVSTLIVQIETVKGVENIDAILAVDGVDGAMIGPYDLSGSLGVPGQLDHPKVAEATGTMIAACQKASKASGPHIVNPGKEEIEEAFAKGFSFVVLGADMFAFWKWSEQLSETIENLD